jgi:hypothetical protein
VLRTVLPRLDTVKVLRKGVAEVPPGAPQPEPPHAAPAKGKKGAAQADAMAAAALPPAVAAVLATQSVGGGRTAFGAAIDDVRAALEKGTSAGASKRPPSSSSAALSSSSMQLVAPAAPAGRRARGPNKDALFLVTADPRPALEAVLEAAVLMETHEVPVPRNPCVAALARLSSVYCRLFSQVHMLSARHKLAALKALAEACFESTRLVDLLERNANERFDLITANNKVRSRYILYPAPI